MDDALSRIWTDLIGRIGGPMSFRVLLQPVMGFLFAVRDGVKDARAGRPPYLWAMFARPEERRWMMRDGWRAIGRVVLLAFAMDIAYQLSVFRRFYPIEHLDVVLILAILPYCLLRGPVNRLVRWWTGP